MNRVHTMVAAMLLAAALIGCAVAAPLSGWQVTVPTPQAGVGEKDTDDTVVPETPAHAHPEVSRLIDQAAAHLARRLGVSPDSVVVEDAVPTEFADASLGAPEPGRMYAQVVTPGYVITLSVDGLEYVYHASEDLVVAIDDVDSPVAAPGVVPPGDAQHLVELAMDDLAARMGMSRDEIVLLAVEETEFADASLGVSRPGEMYAQVITPGYVISLSADGAEYRYHAADGRVVRAEGDPAVPGLPAALPSGWVPYTNDRCGVRLAHPAEWQEVGGYDNRVGGDDGFFQLNAADGVGIGVMELARREAEHKLAPYGSSPTLEPMVVDGQDAVLVLPSDDQPQEMERLATLVIALPEPRVIDGHTYGYLLLHADVDHILPIAGTLLLVD